MGLTVIGSPDDRLRSAGEHTVIEVQSDDYISTAGSVSKLEIVVSAIAVDSEEITIHFSDYVFLFTARTVYLNDGYDWPAAGPTLEQYADKIIEALLMNPIIIANFNISKYSVTPNYIIIIEAKEKGTELNFTSDPAYYSGITGIVSYIKSDGVDTEYYDFHGIDLTLFNGIAGFAYSTILGGSPFFSSRKTLDENGKVKFDLRKFADSFLSKHIQYPEFHNIIFRPNHLAQLVAVVSESKGLPVSPSSAVSTIHRAFVHGGLSYEAESYYNTTALVPFPIHDSGQTTQELPFLTLQPGNKKVFFEQVEKLFYFCYHAYTNIYLKVKITKTDGTVVNSYTSASFSTVKNNSMFEIVVSPYRLNLTNFVNLDEIKSWDVWLQDLTGNHISETKTYILRNEYFTKKRQFIFLTSRGGFDTIVCTGEKSFDQEVDRALFEVMPYPEHSPNDAETAVLQNIEKQKYDISTGWITDETNEWLRDFALAKIIFEVDDDGQFYRVHMTSKKVFKRRDNEFLYKMDFEYSRSYKDEFHTPFEFDPLYNVNLHSKFPKPVSYPSLANVVGRIYTDSDDYRDMTFNGVAMVLGQRFLIINPTTLIGDIKVYDTAGGGSFSSSWSISFNTGGNDYTISLESYAGNRVYSEYEDAVFQVDGNGVWMVTSIIDSAVPGDGSVTVKGKTFDNVEVDIYGALLKDGTYELIGTVTPAVFRSTGLIFQNVSNYTYVKAVTKHCLFIYDDSEQTLITV